MDDAQCLIKRNTTAYQLLHKGAEKGAAALRPVVINSAASTRETRTRLQQATMSATRLHGHAELAQLMGFTRALQPHVRKKHASAAKAAGAAKLMSFLW
ncbi:MAG: hypothetical protein RMN51_05950 [Verrucomicrobiota bacterium]|nr:hypothetical protein [Limisphaera sp.]MDW8381635.1 hypothetical protein [Verrucomicrobiota bacterium]